LLIDRPSAAAATELEGAWHQRIEFRADRIKRNLADLGCRHAAAERLKRNVPR
jgi:hypothetical protein